MHHPTDRTYQALCYTSRGALAGLREDGNVLFNDTLKIVYLQLYVGYMV